MPDYGAIMAEKAIGTVNRKLRATYRQAEKELRDKLSEFLRKHEEKDRSMLKKVADGLISEQDYKNWQTGQLFMEKQWKDKIDQCAKVMLHSNEEAAKIVHEKKLDVFTENYNHQAYELAKEIGTDMGFNTYNTQSVARLVRRKPDILPKWKIDQKKDYKWNYKKVVNSVKQGIIQGEGIDQIADRLVKNLCTQNENKMRMFARTAVTGAQNAGRIEQMHDAEECGVKMKKKWLATLDSRTRDLHQELDGQEVPVNEPFKIGEYEIDFPGDPSAEPEMVYNCRCTMIYVYEGIDRKSVRRDEDDNAVEDMTYKEWKEAKENGTLPTDRKMVEEPISQEKQFTSTESQDRISMDGFEPASLKYINNQEDFYRNVEQIKPIDGYEDVASHGDQYGFTFKDMEGHESNISVADFAEMLENNPEYHGGDIRLIVCEAGADGSVVAQGIADRLGVNVLAPSDVLWVNEDGTMTIGKKPLDNDGEWRLFKPKRK